VVQCEGCGFRFTNPRPDENEIGKYYQAEEYISHSDTSKGLVNKLYKIVRNYTIGKKVKLINRQTINHSRRDSFGATSTIKRLLDIGCGTAEFLHACKTNGWNVTGIEPSEVARKKAKEKFDLPIYPSLQALPLGGEGGGLFNVITLWHVLEHVHELEKTITEINKLLLDDGTLIVAVPNCDAWDAKKYGAHWAAWDVPRHLYHFTRKDIETLFKKYGFKLSEVLPMKFDSFYVSLLSEKYKTARLPDGQGKSNLISGFMNGLISNFSADKNGYSSQIYIMKKN